MMRAALWFLGLFGLAVALALFAGNNDGVVSVFWHPYRVDLSLNVVLLLLVGGFLVVHAALRGLAALVQLPHQARSWRQQQKERAMYLALVQALSHLQAGRYVRARKAAEQLLQLSEGLTAEGVLLQRHTPMRAIAHMLAADSAHALRDKSARDQHFEQAIEAVPANGSQEEVLVREGAQMRAARWALDDRQPELALQLLQHLPPGAARRTMALRMQLKASRLTQDHAAALETTRALAKHGGLSPANASSLSKGLFHALLQEARDTEQLQRAWKLLPLAERTQPELAIAGATRWLQLQGDGATARQWLLPVWEQYIHAPHAMEVSQASRLIATLHQALTDMDPAWLSSIEAAQRSAPHEAKLQYLAGMACMERQLWGKAEQLLQGAAQRLQDAHLRAQAWKALAQLAELREDEASATHAWRQAAQIALAPQS